MRIRNTTMDLSKPDFGDSSNDTENNQRIEGEDYIEWNGEEIEDFITVTDRDGEEHHFPKIEERSAEGELYRFALMVNYLWGGEIGQTDDISSTRLPEDHRNFPNEWIGQTEENPEGSIQDARSPRAYLYREFGAQNGFRDNDGPLPEIRDAFHEKCDYSIEAYKANFPEATGWSDQYDMVKVDEHPIKQWEDRWIPEPMAEKFDGMPPLRQEVDTYTESEEDTEKSGEETESDEESDEEFSLEKIERIIENSSTDGEAVKGILDYGLEFYGDERMYDQVEWIEEAVGCSNSRVYSARKEWKQELEEGERPEEDTETETEEESENDENDQTDSDEDLKERVEELENEMEQMKKVQHHLTQAVEILTDME